MKTPQILLIEDDRWLAESYVRSLRGGYAVEVVASSDEAIDALDGGRFDAIVADVMLEHGLVIDLLHELQSHSDLAQIPVILCTNLAAAIDAADVAAYGVVDVCDKTTLTPAGLRIAIQRALSPKAA